ncbi:MAG TPA: DUF6174 domain-containing protein [Anaerolineales bacterium]|nr:DUF6174 domain-containing protein [Anaerolineales bacterium]
MKKLILLTLIVFVSACSFGTSTELEKNRQTWQDSGIRHYRFSLHIGCFCAFRDQMPISVEVQNGEVISMTYPNGSLVAVTDPNYETFSRHATIDRIFSELEAGLAGGADEVTVTYDPTRGFPNDIYFDYIKAAADDELSITASNFEVLY